MHRAFVFYPGDRLSEAELCAARLDGHVVEVGEAYAPADTVETPAMRAASLRPLVGDVLAASHLSAAWIYGGIPAHPRRHTVQRAVGRLPHAWADARTHYRDVRIPDVDLVVLGGVLVTTPERTLADLARVDDAEHREAFELFARAEPGMPARALTWLEQQGPIWSKRAGRDRLLRWIQEEVTR